MKVHHNCLMDSGVNRNMLEALIRLAEDANGQELERFLEILRENLFDEEKSSFNKVISTALFSAAKKGNLETVKVLIAAGAKVKNTSILTVVAKDAVAKALIESGADVTAKNPEGSTPLVSVIIQEENDNKSVVQTLLDAGADVNQQSQGSTALHQALKTGNFKVAKALVAAGANVNDVDNFGRTPIFMFKPESDEGREMMKILLKADCNVNLGKSNGLTALHLFAQESDLLAVKMLLEAGAVVDSVDHAAMTPLMWSKNCQVIRVLLEAGADVGRCSQGGWTALYTASGKKARGKFSLKLVEILCFVRKKDVSGLRALLEAGAKVDAARDNGWTPLMNASYRRFSASVRLLLEAGAEVDRFDEDGCTALIRCCKGSVEFKLEDEALKDFQDIVELLVGFNCNVNLADNQGNTALIYVCQTQPLLGEVMAFLLDQGSRAGIRNCQGKTAFDYCCLNNDSSDEATKMLKELCQEVASLQQLSRFSILSNIKSRRMTKTKVVDTLHLPDVLKVFLKSPSLNLLG